MHGYDWNQWLRRSANETANWMPFALTYLVYAMAAIVLAVLLPGCASSSPSSLAAPRLPTPPVSKESLPSTDWQRTAETYSNEARGWLHEAENWSQEVETHFRDVAETVRSQSPRPPPSSTPTR